MIKSFFIISNLLMFSTVPKRIENSLKNIQKEIQNLNSKNFDKVFEKCKPEIFELINLTQNLNIKNEFQYSSNKNDAQKIKKDILAVYSKISKKTVKNNNTKSIKFSDLPEYINVLSDVLPFNQVKYLESLFENFIKLLFSFLVLDFIILERINLSIEIENEILRNIRQTFEIFAAYLILLNIWTPKENTKNQLERNIIITSRILNKSERIKITSIKDLE